MMNVKGFRRITSRLTLNHSNNKKSGPEEQFQNSVTPSSYGTKFKDFDVFALTELLI